MKPSLKDVIGIKPSLKDVIGIKPSLKDVIGIGDLVHPAVGNGEIPPPSSGLLAPPANAYGCHNRPEKAETVTVQDGWFRYKIGRFESRLPRMIEVPDPMSRDCRYDKAHSDTRCTGCIHTPEKKS